MKKIKTAVLGLMGLCLIGAQEAKAAASATVTINVTITQTASIVMNTSGAISLGSMSPGAAASVTTSSQTFTNNGSGGTETFKLSIDATSLPAGWSAGSAAGAETFVLKADTNASPTTVLGTTPTTVASGVAYNGSVGVYVSFTPPTTTVFSGAAAIKLIMTVTAP